MNNTTITMDVKTRSKSFKITITALFAALTCISTMVIQIPSPANGYIHPGDCFVLLSGWILGPFYGFIAAGTGGMMADLLSGYAIYAPATFIIKGIMSITAYLLIKMMSSASILPSKTYPYISSLISETIMVIGYFVFAAVFLGTGIAAAASIPGNIVQGVFAVVATPMLFELIKKMHI